MNANGRSIKKQGKILFFMIVNRFYNDWLIVHCKSRQVAGSGLSLKKMIFRMKVAISMRSAFPMQSVHLQKKPGQLRLHNCINNRQSLSCLIEIIMQAQPAQKTGVGAAIRRGKFDYLSFRQATLSLGAFNRSRFIELLFQNLLHISHPFKPWDFIAYEIIRLQTTII